MTSSTEMSSAGHSGGCISRGLLDCRTDHARGRRGFGRRACAKARLFKIMQTHPNSLYGTRSKAASLSTPNFSTLHHSVSPTTTEVKSGAYRGLVCLQLDSIALRPLQREESGLLRRRRGIWSIWEDFKGECCAFTRKASATATQEGSSSSPTVFPA